MHRNVVKLPSDTKKGGRPDFCIGPKLGEKGLACNAQLRHVAPNRTMQEDSLGINGRAKLLYVTGGVT